ncbi:lamin-A-like isoform 2-T4 [Syngnathus typhle]
MILTESFLDQQKQIRKMATPENTPQDAYNELKAIYETELANVRATRDSERERLQVELSKLRLELQDLEESLGKGRKELAAEALRRVNGEKRIQTLKKELEFQKKLHSAELREVKRRHESCMVELENARQKNDSKLANAIKEMQSQLELHKLYIYKKVAAHSVKMEEALSTGWNLWKKSREMRERMQQNLDEYQELRDVKPVLDMEINPHREQLDSEEERVRPTTSASGKRKRLNTDNTVG